MPDKCYPIPRWLLKVILMSATLNAKEFQDYFEAHPKVAKVPSLKIPG